ncbi:putative glycerol-3-phosphate acyltransferase 8 [Sarracenia purpurea var. burkii]
MNGEVGGRNQRGRRWFLLIRVLVRNLSTLPTELQSRRKFGLINGVQFPTVKKGRIWCGDTVCSFRSDLPSLPRQVVEREREGKRKSKPRWAKRGVMPPSKRTTSTTGKKSFPSITSCDASAVNNHSIAADLDGTLLISRSSFPYFMLVAIEAGSLLRGLVLLLSFPLIAIAYVFVSESLAIQMLIFISFYRLKIRDIELASRAVLPRFYAADVRAESYEVFEKCKRKVVVTANPTVMVEPFVREYLGGDKVLGTEIEVNPKTKRATGFVKKPGILVGKWKKLAILKEFEEESPDIGIGDRESDHDFMSICKVCSFSSEN